MARRRKFWLGVALFSAGVIVVTVAAVSGRPMWDWRSWFGDEGAHGGVLYARHCATCHGAAGEGRVRGNATTLNNSDFLAVASDRFLEMTVARGRRDTEMSAWATEAGGPLNRSEIRAIVTFIRRWQGPAQRLPVPEVIQGDPARGRDLYATACANCHGWEGRGELGMGPAVTNPDLLAVADDGFLWATIAYGRRDTPMFPSLRGLKGVRQFSEQEVNDLVAYLRARQRERRGDFNGAQPHG